jgi:signal peptidase I
MSKKLFAESANPSAARTTEGKGKPKPHDGGWRETIESLAMAVILALLFKGYVAEAFVIPTGSMAPTLQGQHKDVVCPQCQYGYQTTASDELDRSGFLTGNQVISGTCPVCQYTQTFDPRDKPNDGSFSGDRIIVSKFAYEIGDPKRWDVIVFKWPQDASQNYIKRLVGLPGEHLTISGGNVYVRSAEADPQTETIARKPPHKLNAMLQIVDDSRHIPELLQKIGWPSRWREWSEEGSPSQVWTTEDGGKSFTGKSGEATAWLRYRHLVPTYDDWQTITLQNRLPMDVAERRGELITDLYAYNTSVYVKEANVVPDPGYYKPDHDRTNLNDVPDRLKSPNGTQLLYDPKLPGPGAPPREDALGLHWVDDLAMEVLAEIKSEQGVFVLSLVRAGVHHRAEIDVKTGKATLSRVDAAGMSLPFVDDSGKEVPSPTASTPVQGAGSYRLRLTNVDHQVMLFVNGKPMTFDQPTTYDSDDIVSPQWTERDALDLEPAGIGIRGLEARVSEMKILRDKYYIAVNNGYAADYVRLPNKERYLQEVFRTPEMWTSSEVFNPDNRNFSEYTMGPDQFFPMGDNSPYSSDGRYWNPEDYLTRDLLIGKALVIYWPHSWNRPMYWPDFRRMGRIQ